MDTVTVNMNRRCKKCGKPGVYETDDRPGKLCGKCILKKLDALFKAVEEKEKSDEEANHVG
jgi:NMD protein affecting ribosome stability and mRNA decay